jgi:cytochrome c
MRTHIIPNRSVRLRLPLLAALALCGAAPPSVRAKTAAPPDETRFTKTVLVDGLDEPFQLEFDPRGRVYWIERSSGNVKRFDESTGEVTLLGKIPTTVVAEGGLLGILLARDFASSRQIYFYYTFVRDSLRESRLSRYTLGRDDRLDPASEVVLLRWSIDTQGHMGGGMTWDAKGNLYLSTGDNSAATQYAPLRFTEPGGAGQDALRTAGSTNDLRGKILRIHPEPDGTYTIPAGNLFAPGTPKTRPEIYTMGDRNPWRLSIDSRTGYLHWGEIGPDAGKDSVGVGPRGYDEFNVAKRAGNFGWPMFIGYNLPYARFDYATKTDREPFDPARPVNPSPNNTGLDVLPPAQPALIAYPYAGSEEYPLLGSGGRAAVGGPVFHRADFGPEAEHVFPAYYEGKWFVIDYVRNWIMAVTLDPASSKVVSIERFLPGISYLNPLDMTFGPDGDLYVVEYAGNGQGKISKIEYNGGNRPPKVTIHASATAGATPLRVTLSSAGTVDYDHDRLRYDWSVTPVAGGTTERFSTPSAAITLAKPGEYRVVLTATDPSGAAGSAEVRVVAGNEPPSVALDVTRGNRSFYFPGSSVDYRVRVTDREDGPIPPAAVKVTGEFVPSGLTPAQAEAARALDPESSARNLQALAIMARSDCRGCHSETAKLVGPAFQDVAARYRGQPGAAEHLAQKIVTGGSGAWGTVAMPPHPTLTAAEATTLAEYVLSLGAPGAAPRRLAMQGTFATPGPANPPADQNPARVAQMGSYLLRASYTDRGANGVPPITSTSAVLLRQPRLAPQDADTISAGTSYAPSLGDPMFTVNRSGAFIGFRNLDLTGIDSIAVGVLTRFYAWSHFIGGTVEVRLDSPSGPLLSPPVQVTPPAAPVQQDGGQPPTNPTAAVFLGANLEKPVPFPVGSHTGMHDVYIVFRNPNAGPASALFLVTGVEFRPAARSGIPAGFTSIFNGENLAGWHISRTTHHGSTGDFRAEDGSIVLRQHPYGQGGLLMTDRRYRNFDLYFETRLPWGINSGLFFRSSESGSAYQLELVGGGAAGTGNLISEMMTLSRPAEATGLQRVWKEDGWNSFRLRVEGDVPHMTLWVNGVQMWDVTQTRNDKIAGETDGYIGLQLHWTNTYTPIPDAQCCAASWRPGAAVSFRNLAIRELP